MNPYKEIIILDGSETREMLEMIRDKKPVTPSATLGMTAESRAMIQSMYSRSPKSARSQIEKVLETDSGSFMEKFYVNYGHKSIGDCGFITIFVEQVSMFVAKAIQDNRLYTGQEASTRYLDFSQQPIIDPVGTPESKAILDKWSEFYVTSGEPLRQYLTTQFPIKDGEDPKSHERAIKVRAFDILRGFLPSGTTTLLAWTTNLRQAADKLAILRQHPMEEVREAAEAILTALRERYPLSFSQKDYEDQTRYIQKCQEQYFYAPESSPEFELKLKFDIKALEPYQELLTSRPKFTELPLWLDEVGQIEVNYLLDFGSFRDVQRHRAGIVRMPLIETRWGVHSWYLNQMSPELRTQAEALIAEQNKSIEELVCDKYTKQYYIPMGYNVPVKMTFNLPGLVYLAELRSGKTVHPTLRQRAHQMTQALSEKIPFLTLHSDRDLDDWDVRRGTQTIIDTSTGKAISD